MFTWDSVKFRGNTEIPRNGQIPRLGSKFCGSQKTVGPDDDDDDDDDDDSWMANGQMFHHILVVIISSEEYILKSLTMSVAVGRRLSWSDCFWAQSEVCALADFLVMLVVYQLQ